MYHLGREVVTAVLSHGNTVESPFCSFDALAPLNCQWHPSLQFAMHSLAWKRKGSEIAVRDLVRAPAEQRVRRRMADRHPRSETTQGEGACCATERVFYTRQLAS